LPSISLQSFHYVSRTILLAARYQQTMRLNLVRRVRRPSQPPKEKRANRRKSVSYHSLRVLTTPRQLFRSTWLRASLIRVCAIIRLFFSSRTICEFREIHLLARVSRPVLMWSCRSFCRKPKGDFMKIKALSLVFAAVMLLSLSASAATVNACCGNPACCDGGTCCS
jgi:hypothetical protein